MALKIVKSAKQYTEVARDEISLLKKVMENDKDDSHCIVHLIDSFEHQGPNGIRTYPLYTSTWRFHFELEKLT